MKLPNQKKILNVARSLITVSKRITESNGKVV